MKRALDFSLAFCGLAVLSPILALFMFLIWSQDFCSPLYIAPRVGKDGKIFSMIKLRSMIADADKLGVDSTSNEDERIPPVGGVIRRLKLDEIVQLWNVFVGDMSLVGPRPNVKRETDLYTAEEKKILLVKPGVTDIASIVFADEGKILSGEQDPDIAYAQLIRPGKSRLALLYVEIKSFRLDIWLVTLTILSIISRRLALDLLAATLQKKGADRALVQLAKRESELIPMPPPGTTEIVTSRDL